MKHAPLTITCIILILGITAYVAIPTPRESLEREHIQQLIAQGQLDLAAQLATQHQREQGNPPSAACLLAEILIAQGRASEAVALLKPIRQTVERADVCEMLGRSLIANNQAPAGQHELETALKLNPKRLSVIKILANLYLQQGRNARAAAIMASVKNNPALQSPVIRLAIRENDAAVLARLIDSADAMKVGCVLAMAYDQPHWPTELVSPAPGSEDAWATFVHLWQEEPSTTSAATLVTLLLDQLDDPLNSPKPLPRVADERARLHAVAAQHWPNESLWHTLAASNPPIIEDVFTEAMWLNILMDDTTSPRRWDAAAAKLQEQIGAQALLTLINQTERNDTLALAWQANLHHLLDDDQTACAVISRVVLLDQRLPRVLTVMGKLLPTPSNEPTTWPGLLN